MKDKSLTVYYHKVPVGNLVQTPDGRLQFRYAKDWLENENVRPLSQSLPLKDATYNERECVGFFGGLLPEEYNREIIARNLGISARNDFAMLGEIGGEQRPSLRARDAGRSRFRFVLNLEPSWMVRSRGNAAQAQPARRPTHPEPVKRDLV